VRAHAGGARRRGRVRQPRADRVGQPDVAHEPGAEEAALAPGGAVDELVDRDEVAGREFLAQRADAEIASTSSPRSA
jgi:hypothetical protein